MSQDRTLSLALLILVALGLTLVSTAYGLSATYDEPAYLGCGIAYVEHHEVAIGLEHPPLMKLVLGAALHAAGVREGPVAAALYSGRQAAKEPVRLEYEYADALLSRDGSGVKLPFARSGADSVFVLGRLALIPFALLLAVVTWLWARARSGPWGGIVALALIATWPDFLGHGALATLDVPVGALSLLAAYAFDRRLETGSPRWAVVAGAAFGAALATKLTALLLAPALVILVLLQARSAPAGRRALARDALLALAALALALVLVFALAGASPLVFLENVRERTRSYQALATWHTGVCLGRFDTRFPYYFLVACALKLPLGTLALLGLLVASCFSERPSRGDLAWLLPGLFFFVGTSVAGLPLGSRYVIPAIPFFFVGCGRLAKWASTPRRRAAIGFLLLANAASAAREHPFHQSSVNALAGDPRVLYRLLDDSNQDWGGGFKALARWERERGVTDPVVVVHATLFSARHLDAYGVTGRVALGDVLFAPVPGNVYVVQADVVSQMRLREQKTLAEDPGAPRLVLGGSVLPKEIVGGGLLVFEP
jgi:hypothetical protein